MIREMNRLRPSPACAGQLNLLIGMAWVTKARKRLKNSDHYKHSSESLSTVQLNVYIYSTCFCVFPWDSVLSL